MKKKIVSFLLILVLSKTYGFDFRYYFKTNPELEQLGIKGMENAINHYINVGKEAGLKAVPVSYEPTNFDWQFYVKHNNLSIKNEVAALIHYKTYGQQQNLPCCKAFKIVIFLHLYDIELIDEFIEKINYFVQLNSYNDYYLKINIPIDKQIYRFNKGVSIETSEASLLKDASEATPYHKNLITIENSRQLLKIKKYLITNMQISSENIEVIFSENKGLDIGSFFLLLGQVIKQNIDHDFIIKLHSKKNNNWRNILTSFLNIPINKLLSRVDGVYSNNFFYNPHSAINNDPFGFRIKEKKYMEDLCDYFKIPLQSFNFCAGTIFITSNKVTDFFRPYNPLDLFNMFKKEAYQKGGMLEHGFERFFGCLFKHLNLKIHILDYYPPYKASSTD